MGIIYKIQNLKNGKIYIGQTIGDLENRWYHHRYDALNHKSKTKIGIAIRKYGPENFSVMEIESTEKLDEREIFWISHFKSVKNGYNIKIGGNGGPHSDSTKNKISKANSKREWTEEMRATMSLAIKAWHSKRGFVPRSEEFSKKISEANRKRKMSTKTKEHFSKYNESNKKPILCITNGKEYESITAACKDLGLNDGHLGQHLKGKHKHVKGFVFKRK